MRRNGWRMLPAGILLAGALSERATPGEVEDHEALRALRKIYEQAVNQDDVDLLKPHLDPEFSGVMMTNEVVPDFAHLRTYWGRIRELTGKGGRYVVEFSPERSVIYGDLALVHGSTRDHVRTGDGKEYRFETNWTALCRRKGGEWKILRAHASMDPVGNAFVKQTVRTLLLKVGLGALGLGLLLGWLARTAYALLRRR